MYLLDTNVVSELRRPRPSGVVVRWLQGIEDRSLHVSAVTLGEIQAGIELTRDQDEGKADEIQAWLDRVESTYNVLPVDGPTLRTWARLMHRKSNTLIEDGLIAATAVVHSLTVVTRNVDDFKVFGVPVVDPFAPTRR